MTNKTVGVFLLKSYFFPHNGSFLLNCEFNRKLVTLSINVIDLLINESLRGTNLFNLVIGTRLLCTQLINFNVPLPSNIGESAQGKTLKEKIYNRNVEKVTNKKVK